MILYIYCSSFWWPKATIMNSVFPVQIKTHFDCKKRRLRTLLFRSKWFTLMAKTNDNCELCFSVPSDSFWQPERTMITIYELVFSCPSDSFWRPERTMIMIYELGFSGPSDSFWLPKWRLRTSLFFSSRNLDLEPLPIG